MRTLKFIVDGQSIAADPNCDFSGLVPGTEGYVRVEFAFSPEWNGCVKAASFWSPMGKEYPGELLKDGCSCMVPTEALKKRKFLVQVVGKRDDYKILTHKVAVCQNGGNE